LNFMIERLLPARRGQWARALACASRGNRLKPVPFVLAMFWFCIAMPSHSAPLEENISGSAAGRTATGSRSLGRTRVQPLAEAPDEGTTGDETPSVPAVVSQPRASFPYAVRPGDTPASIALLFGVPLPDFMR